MQSDFTRVILLYVGLSQTYLFARATQDGFDKCLFFRTSSNLRSPTKWEPILAASKLINDSEIKYSDLPFKHMRSNAGKRSLSTLAKNDDMPSTHFQDGQGEGDNGDSPYRYDDVDKKVLNKVVKYLHHVKRRNNAQKLQNNDARLSSDDSTKETRYSTGPNEAPNVKVLTEDYIFCNNGNGVDLSPESYDNLRNINNLLRETEVYCDHNEIYSDKDKINLAFNCVIRRYPSYDSQLNTLKEKLQDANFLSIILNALNNEQVTQVLKTSYPQVDKRFMGRIPEMGPRFTTPPTRRHGR